MKLGEIGIFSQFEAASPEAMRAQRMAELEQMAKYRSQKIQAYKDWSEKPEHREAMKAKVESEARDERRVVSAEAERFAKEFDEADKKQVGAVRPVYKPIKRNWWQRLLDWFDRL